MDSARWFDSIYKEYYAWKIAKFNEQWTWKKYELNSGICPVHLVTG